MESAEPSPKVIALTQQLRKRKRVQEPEGSEARVPTEPIIPAHLRFLQAAEAGFVRTSIEGKANPACLIIFRGSWVSGCEVTYISSDIALALGYSAEELLHDQQAAHQLIHPEDLSQMIRDLDIQSLQEVVYQTYRLRHKDGQYHGIQGHLKLILSKHKITDTIESWLGILNIEMITTGSQRAEQLLQGIADATKYLQLYSDDPATAMVSALSVLGKTIDVDRVYLIENSCSLESQEPTITYKSGWMKPGSSFVDIMSSWNGLSYQELGLKDWIAALANGKPITGSVTDLPAQALVRLPQNLAHSYLLVPLHIDKHLWGFIGLFDSIPERSWLEGEISALSTISASLSGLLKRHQVEAELRHNALHDPLTHLPNRRLFLDRLQQVLQLAEQSETYLFAVLFLDLDRFKIINDSLGHLVGDQLLTAIAHRLKECIRPRDIVARLGGDEFTVLLTDVKHPEDVTHIAARIQHQVAKPFHLGLHEVFVSVSIGITLSSAGYKQPEDFLRAADTAMYRAKQSGGSRHQFYDVSMHTHAKKQLQIETDLKRALEREELVVHYQPIISLVSGRIAGFEALVRWQHPDHGLISPAEFIPIAEELDLIILIDFMVMKIACRQAQLWNQRYLPSHPLTLSVNLSSRHFTQPSLIKEITNILTETQFDPQHLRVEITETSMIKNIELTSDLIAQLQALNIGVYLDDFGTGYSCLSNLRHFPISAIKIDRSFIRSLDVDNENYQIVRAILILAHNLGMDVIAEGIELQNHMKHLQDLRCEYGQGYLFSRPIGCQEAELLIKKMPCW